ncbi:glycosyltransferase family 2 protein [Calidifontibacillus erzurumensis]|uniref:Glycosyltransferase family 2 protein n=1 Tax=Calidifontibacillus erzurumensis TaxID=2741433 RepID=A0A8J8GF62_9BACI|nr:glycosyltransferase family 2 protein [Calidifontibacillus erzurumensis]NSL52031.1 glycosyltransferase family 2 protein [Calidifontibacillus erzurumensis]
MDVSIIIVNFNTKQLTLDAIRSVFQSKTRYSYEILLVDNNSTDGSVQAFRKEFPQITMIENKENVGFSKANNQAIRIAKGNYILLLNSDTIIQEDTLEVMLDFMEAHPRVGASGCKVVLPDGTLDQACRRGFPTPEASFYYFSGLAKLFPTSPRFNQYHLGHLDPDKDYPVDCLVGAFMLLRRDVIEQVGLLDEEFFMYGEDIDWCYRIKKAGWDIYYYPYTSIIHYKGASSRRKPMKIIYEFHRAMALFHRKHFSKKYPFFINGLVYTGIGLKFLLSVVLNLIKTKK